MLDLYDPRDERSQLDQFRDLVLQYRKKADDLRGQMARGPRRVALVRLQTETQALLREAVYLITNAPIQVHDTVGDDVFENMHQDVADAEALDEPSPLETSDLVLRQERLSISVDLARYVLDLLNDSIRRVAADWSSGVQGAPSSGYPGDEDKQATRNVHGIAAAEGVRTTQAWE